MSFRLGDLRKFIEGVQQKMELNSDELGKLVNLSGRTIRDWKREKFNPQEEVILKLSNISGVSVPEHKLLSKYWYVQKGASIGGKKHFELYGAPGNKASRSKGGKISWFRRKDNPELWKIYSKQIQEPKESVELAEFFGIALGDGGLTKSQLTIYLNSEIDKDYAQYVARLILELFKIQPKIYKHHKHKMLKVSVSGVNLVKYLTLKGLSTGNKVRLQVGVPEWIWSDPEYIKACLRGLIDTDGSFILHRYQVNGREYAYPRISFSNRSEPILDFVNEGLKKLGFHPKRSYNFEVALFNQAEVKQYLRDIGVSNYKPAVKKILEGGPDGKARVC